VADEGSCTIVVLVSYKGKKARKSEKKSRGKREARESKIEDCVRLKVLFATIGGSLWSTFYYIFHLTSFVFATCLQP
jgi:hypothetical protein